MIASEGDGAPVAPVPISASLTLRPMSRSLARLWAQIKKAAIPAIVTGVLGYGSGFVIPPTAVFDYLFRQNPNDLGGTWIGAAAGAIATLRITEIGGRKLAATLEIDGRSYELRGNRDSQVVLYGSVGPDHELHVGLKRLVGIRFFEDSAFIKLVPDEKHAPFLLCKKDTLNITGVTNCRSIGEGATIFSRERNDPK